MKISLFYAVLRYLLRFGASIFSSFDFCMCFARTTISSEITGILRTLGHFRANFTVSKGFLAFVVVLGPNFLFPWFRFVFRSHVIFSHSLHFFKRSFGHFLANFNILGGLSPFLLFSSVDFHFY